MSCCAAFVLARAASKRASLRCRRGARAASSVSLLRPLPSAPREVPTPLVLFSPYCAGGGDGAVAAAADDEAAAAAAAASPAPLPAGLAAAARRAGFTVALVRVAVPRAGVRIGGFDRPKRARADEPEAAFGGFQRASVGYRPPTVGALAGFRPAR